MSEAGWSLTESDPAIFSQLVCVQGLEIDEAYLDHLQQLWELGVKGLEVAELWALDPSLLDNLKPVHALIFVSVCVNIGLLPGY